MFAASNGARIAKESFDGDEFVVDRCGRVGGPRVLLHNALGMERSIWEPLCAVLAERYELLLLQRSWTELQRLDAPLTARRPVPEERALDHFIERHAPHAAIAWCSGAQALAACALTAPRSLERLILMSPGLNYSDPARRSPNERLYDDVMPRILANNSLARLISRSLSNGIHVKRFIGDANELGDVAALERILRRSFESPSKLVEYAKDFVAFRASTSDLALERLTLPTLVVGGSEDQLVLPGNFDSIASALADAVRCFGRFDHYALFMNRDVHGAALAFLAGETG